MNMFSGYFYLVIKSRENCQDLCAAGQNPLHFLLEVFPGLLKRLIIQDQGLTPTILFLIAIDSSSSHVLRFLIILYGVGF